MNLEDLKKYDSSQMYKIYDQWPKLAKKSYDAYDNQIEFGGLDSIDNIVFAGMGGSGIVGNIFSSLLSKTDLHVSIVKGYSLPKTVNSNSLLIATSVSGNTLETLTVLDSARQNTDKIIAFSDGGKIKDFCIKNNIQHQKIENLISPRSSFPSMLYSILKTLDPILPITKNEVINSIISMEEIRKKISSSNLNEDNPSLDIAEWITDIPLIYYPRGLEAAAIRFKNSLQENAKIHAMIEDIIESCHNNIVAWKKTSNVKPILIQGKDDFIKTNEVWKILKEFFTTQGIQYKEIFSVKGNILTKLNSLIYLLDYASIYLAVLLKTDPTPIPAIDFVKKRISANLNSI